MINNEQLKQYKEIKRLTNIIKVINNINKSITLEDMNIPYIKELVISLGNYKTYLTNTIRKKCNKYKFKEIQLNIDDLLILSLLDK